MSEVREKAILAKKTTRILNNLSTKQKNEALLRMADSLVKHKASIITANTKDLQRGEEQGLSKSLLDRLALNTKRIESMADGLREIVELPDPIGDLLEEFHRPNGLRIMKLRVPIGLIGIIYEARPNVTVDAAGLCLKTGNAVLLRGGSAALYSNQQIVDVLHEAMKQTDIPVDALQIISSSDRSSVDEMLKLNGLLDVVIPRGGHSLIQNVVNNATVPVIETGAGICHTYIDVDCDLEMATRVALNAKIQRPSVCNAMETLLVHIDYAKHHLLALAEQYRSHGVEIRGCSMAKQLVPWINDATEEDWDTEYNDYILSVKVVHHMDEALTHIDQYGTMHSECIITENQELADQFIQDVDAAAVYHNASTRFTDGFEFGFGAEIGISTQKLHARGPMGLPALTSTKYCVFGDGQTKE